MNVSKHPLTRLTLSYVYKNVFHVTSSKRSIVQLLSATLTKAEVLEPIKENLGALETREKYADTSHQPVAVTWKCSTPDWRASGTGAKQVTCEETWHSPTMVRSKNADVVVRCKSVEIRRKMVLRCSHPTSYDTGSIGLSADRLHGKTQHAVAYFRQAELRLSVK